MPEQVRLVLHVSLIITSALLLRNFVGYEKNMIRNYSLFLRLFAKCRIGKRSSLCTSRSIDTLSQQSVCQQRISQQRQGIKIQEQSSFYVFYNNPQDFVRDLESK